mgnify:CR=1 FL=1
MRYSATIAMKVPFHNDKCLTSFEAMPFLDKIDFGDIAKGGTMVALIALDKIWVQNTSWGISLELKAARYTSPTSTTAPLTFIDDDLPVVRSLSQIYSAPAPSPLLVPSMSRLSVRDDDKMRKLEERLVEKKVVYKNGRRVEKGL